MSMAFYPKLAFSGICKNKKLYFPYILTCICLIMMHYILSFLSEAPALKQMIGGDTIAIILNMGSQIVTIFSVLFLFYSNSFLTKRRKKEFGMYNILGMNKSNIGKILLWEFIIISILSIIIGILVGVGLSKLFELGLIDIMSSEINYNFDISFKHIIKTSVIFCGVFILLLISNLAQIALNKPIELIKSENVGEKPPKANWFLGLLGLIIIICAYYIAVTIEDPIYAIFMFFIAVFMVILATYLLFIFGSVLLCHILKKNKSYYYKASHFISVSSMSYRMKQNGAGLASICILLTMVLVMLSSTITLYVGMDDSINLRYPRDFSVEMQIDNDTDNNTLSLIRNKTQSTFSKYNIQNVIDYYSLETESLYTDGIFYNEAQLLESKNFDMNTNSVLTYIIPVSNLNQVSEQKYQLQDNQIVIYPIFMEYTSSALQMNNEKYTIKSVIDDSIAYENGIIRRNEAIYPKIYIFVSDSEFAKLKTAENPISMLQWTYSFDMDLSNKQQLNIYNTIKNSDDMKSIKDIVSSAIMNCKAFEIKNFYSIFGGLFYLGIVLSIVFLLAAVLIIYYKQISEGYEDKHRFEIMQKVGMTKKEIRKSINSQVLMVFFMPLITAGVHLCFAFPMIRKILLIFNIFNTSLLIKSAIICFIVFGLFYMVIYRITSNAYYNIVSSSK